MLNNLPIKNVNCLIENVQKSFRKLSTKYEESNNQIITNDEEKELIDKKKEKFHESIKAEVKINYIHELKREEILDAIEVNQDLLYDLPIEKLEKIEQYYIESISKYEERLRKLKKAV